MKPLANANRRFARLAAIDWAFVLGPIILTSFGIAVLYSFSFSEQKNLASYQAAYAGLGFAVMIFLSLVDYRTFHSIGWLTYGISLTLLILVIFWGSEAFGARRWLDLTIFQLQPSELMKLTLILLLARIFAAGRVLSWRHVLTIGILIAVPVAAVLKQPDLGTAATLGLAAAVLVSHTKMPKWFWLTALTCAVVAAPLVWRQLKPYQRARVATFVNPSSDPSGAGYNVIQSKIAVGSGGIWGRGLGQGPQSQLNFLPVAHTDFIFAAIAEASGFLGSALLILIYGILIWRGVAAATLSQDDYGHFVALGITAIWLTQVFVNIGMNLGLMPVTGIPLPFVSFGGSGMIVNFAAAGILQSIYIRHKKIRFS